MVTFIGDEVLAAAFRLAGAMTCVPAPGTEAQAFADARGRSTLVLLGARCAARIPAATLEAAFAAPSPLVMIVPERDGVPLAPDPALKVRTALGAQP
jgi:vacuolar-type H+-ATPase subunit F/Vma7